MSGTSLLYRIMQVSKYLESQKSLQILASLEQVSTVNPQTTSSNNGAGSQKRHSNATLEISEMNDAEWEQFIAQEKGTFLGYKVNSNPLFSKTSYSTSSSKI